VFDYVMCMCCVVCSLSSVSVSYYTVEHIVNVSASGHERQGESIWCIDIKDVY